MDYDGGFHEMEKDGKLFLVCHHPKYHPIPPTQSHDYPLQLFFVCPLQRSVFDHRLSSSPGYILSTTRTQQDELSVNFIRYRGHPLLPLFWCNNKEFDSNGGCKICFGSRFGTDYYFCDYCKEIFHKECVESPPKIKHPYHPEHSVQLQYACYSNECLCCGRKASALTYHCSICKVFMHTICAMQPVPFVIDQPKRHDHPLTFFPRQTCLTCNVCGLLRKVYPTYVCLRCNFVAHKDCMYSPSIIKISRHHHRISYISSAPSSKWSWGVCHRSIDGAYGGYTCEKCSSYVVHSRCALGKDVWDGEELVGVPEEDDISQDAGPFDIISEGVIIHFLHNHRLQLEASMLYDEKKLCQACAMPIFECSFYSCMECDFILHESCANAPRRIHHPLHSHPLTLKSASSYYNSCFTCCACGRIGGGFVYVCCIVNGNFFIECNFFGTCTFYLDVRCASVLEPFNYQGHKHPLFLALDIGEKPKCQVCKKEWGKECWKQLNCIECDFIVCFKCATLPDKARYKHDKHFLTISRDKEVCEKDWCEVCEQKLSEKGTKAFYWCNECCTILHINCLFGEDPYLKPGQNTLALGKKVQILGKTSLSRPLCNSCKNPCRSKIFKTEYGVSCSLDCVNKCIISFF